MNFLRVFSPGGLLRWWSYMLRRLARTAALRLARDAGNDQSQLAGIVPILIVRRRC